MTAPISLIDVMNHYAQLPHQDTALTFLQKETEDQDKHDDLAWQFARAFRDNDDGSTINFVNVARNYANLPHQNVALTYLQDNLQKQSLAEFATQWRSTPPPTIGAIRLGVTWLPQHTPRTCFSASVFMMAHFSSQTFRNRFPNANDYTPYWRSLTLDTTNPNAHLTALRSLGLNPVYSQDMNLQQVIQHLESGLPVAFGFLHRGSHNAPTGGGHWAVFSGVQANRNMFIVDDPWGSIHDNYTGAQSNGRGVEMSRSILNNRWTVDTPNQDSRDGWALYLPVGTA